MEQVDAAMRVLRRRRKKKKRTEKMASWKSCGKLADELFYRASDITC